MQHSFTQFQVKVQTCPTQLESHPKLGICQDSLVYSQGCSSLGARGTSAYLVTPEVHALWGRGDMDTLHNCLAINVLPIHQVQDRQRPTHNRPTRKSALTPGD